MQVAPTTSDTATSVANGKGRLVGVLRGHSQQALALAPAAHSSASPPTHVASGSDDASLRWWDLATSKAVRAIAGFAAPVAALATSPGCPDLVLAASGHDIFAFDVRAPGPVIARPGDAVAAATAAVASAAAVTSAKSGVGEDDCEVGHIAVDDRAASVAVADDSGAVRLFDLRGLRPGRPLRTVHQNVCAAVEFHPRRPHELWSGGMDCTIVKWDTSRGRPTGERGACANIIDTEDARAADAASTSQVINPPFVHCLHVLPGGDARHGTVAAGLGDGAILLVESKRDAASSNKHKKASLSTTRLTGQHSWSVTALCSSSAPHRSQGVGGTAALPPVLLSAGLDARLVAWSMGTAGTDSGGPRALFAMDVGRKANCMAAERTSPDGQLTILLGGVPVAGAGADRRAGDIDIFTLPLGIESDPNA
ncbi:hypothetical protein HK405_014743 [Cladochytrium tenue]|nr:hypothetical protein HK405_014743 [Cladochytrium tenue]